MEPRLQTPVAEAKAGRAEGEIAVGLPAGRDAWTHLRSGLPCSLFSTHHPRNRSARVGEKFPRALPRCGGDIRLNSFITKQRSFKKILAHLGVPRESPAVSLNRGPPIPRRICFRGTTLDGTPGRAATHSSVSWTAWLISFLASCQRRSSVRGESPKVSASSRRPSPRYHAPLKTSRSSSGRASTA